MKEMLLFRHHGVCRHRNYRKMAQLRLLPYPCSEGKSILIAELHIEQHSIGPAVLEYATRGTQVLRTQDFVPFGFKPIAEKLAIHQVVFHNQNEVFHTFTDVLGATTRASCLSRASCHGCCL